MSEVDARLVVRLRELVDEGGYDGWHPDALHIAAADSLDAATARIAELTDEMVALGMDSGNYRGKCGACGTACMDMLTDKHCASCRIAELDAVQADWHAAVKLLRVIVTKHYDREETGDQLYEAFLWLAQHPETPA
jgi:hypothetical protein